MSYTPTTTSDLLADIRETYVIDPLEFTIAVDGTPATRQRLIDLLDAIHGDPDAYQNLPREWRDLVTTTVHDYSSSAVTWPTLDN